MNRAEHRALQRRARGAGPSTLALAKAAGLPAASRPGLPVPAVKSWPTCSS